MRVSEAFPSNYIKCADLKGREVTVTIDSYKMEDIGDEQKPVLYFRGKEKGLVMNKTNGNNIAAAYGDDMDTWTGAMIALYPARVDFQGRTVDAVRVRPVKAQQVAVPVAAQAQQPVINPAPPVTSTAAFNDEIPF